MTGNHYLDLFSIQNRGTVSPNNYNKVTSVNNLRKKNIFQETLKLDSKMYYSFISIGHILISFADSKVFEAIDIQRCFNRV